MKSKKQFLTTMPAVGIEPGLSGYEPQAVMYAIIIL